MQNVGLYTACSEQVELSTRYPHVHIYTQFAYFTFFVILLRVCSFTGRGYAGRCISHRSRVLRHL